MIELKSIADLQQAQANREIVSGALVLADAGIVEMDPIERQHRRAMCDDLDAAIAEYEQRTGTSFRDNRVVGREGVGIGSIP